MTNKNESDRFEVNPDGEFTRIISKNEEDELKRSLNLSDVDREEVVELMVSGTVYKTSPYQKQASCIAELMLTALETRFTLVPKDAS